VEKKELNNKMKVKKGDIVILLSGKDKGKKGKVLKALAKDLKVVVEGINIAKKHQRKTQNFQGGIIERPNALPVSKVQVVCPRCAKPTKISKVDGQRVCKKCKEVMDKS